MLRLETPRLRVRPFERKDGRDAAAYLADPVTMRWIEPVFDPQKAAAFLQECALCAEPMVDAVEEKASGRVIGHVIFHPYEADSWEIGWILRSDRCGHGYGSELGRALLQHARAARIPTLVAETVPANAASLALIRSLGFTQTTDRDGLLVFTREVW